MPVTASMLISEVGPRVRRQGSGRILPIQFKLLWVGALCAASAAQ